MTILLHSVLYHFGEDSWEKYNKGLIVSKLMEEKKVKKKVKTFPGMLCRLTPLNVFAILWMSFSVIL